MLKVLTYLISFFVGRYQSALKTPSLIIVDQIMLRARKLMMNSMVSLIASLLLTGGVLITLIEFTSQIDRFGVVWPSAALIGGLLLSAFSLAGLIYSFKSASLFKSSSIITNVQAAPKQPSPLEEALGILVMDFVKERREHREQKEPPVPPKAEAMYENTTLQ